jgi:CheY-like chemotaxis protein
MNDACRILLVDDDSDIRTVTRLALQLVAGHVVEECASGAEALAKAPEFAPDLIVMDVLMPEMDGVATMRAMRKDPRFSSTPIIFLTATAQTSNITDFLRMGALCVIRKPFDPLELVEEIGRLRRSLHA